MDIKLFEKLEKEGKDPLDLVCFVEVMEIAADLIDTSANAVKEVLTSVNLYQHDKKKDINRVRDVARNYVKKFDLDTCKESLNASEQYGILSDEMFETMVNIIKNNTVRNIYYTKTKSLDSKDILINLYVIKANNLHLIHDMELTINDNVEESIKNYLLSATDKEFKYNLKEL